VYLMQAIFRARRAALSPRESPILPILLSLFVFALSILDVRRTFLKF
jgi:hypothetical protein